MNASTRFLLWVATLAAVVSLGTAAVPATIQLLDDDTPPAPSVAAPAPPPATTIAVPVTGGNRANDRARDGRGANRGNGGP